MNIKVVSAEPIKNTARLAETYKVKVSSIETIPKRVEDVKVTTADLTFKVGCRVRHIEEGIIGEIKFIGSDKVAIVWNDNTRERMTLAEAKKSLEYVDDIQSIVAPTTPQISDKSKEIPKNNDDVVVNEAIEDALAALDADEVDSSEVIDMDVDLEKIKMQRKMNQMEKKLDAKQTDDMKNKIASELVDLAVTKGIIENDEFDLEVARVTMMDDNEFAIYKQSIIDFESGGHEIVSDAGSMEEINGLTKEEKEARQALQSLRRAGATGGGVSTSASADPDADARSLKGMKQEKIGFYNQYKIPKFEEQFSNILSSAVDNIDSKSKRENLATPKPVQKKKTELPGFENLQGPTIPLTPGVGKSAVYQAPTNTSMKELFAGLEWTTVSKIH